MALIVAAMLLAGQPSQPVQPNLPTEAEVKAAPIKSTPPVAADARVADEIRSLERRWGQAFLTRDFDFLERIIAPEFRLAGASPSGEVSITSRVDWMRNSRAFSHLGFFDEVVDVTTAGNTAVALVKTSWTRKPYADRPPIVTAALVTDTWVRRNGRWQVILRYSHRLPEAPWKASSPPLKQ